MRLLTIALIASALFVLSLKEAREMRQTGRVHNNDFKHLWIGAVVLAEGGDPYDPKALFGVANREGLGAINPFVYLPATGLLMSPFAAMDFEAAASVWFYLNFILAWAALLAAPWLLRRRGEALWIYLAGGLFFAGSLPFYRQMTAGQMNVVLLATLLLATGMLLRGREASAGIVIGVAAAFKIAPVFLIFMLAIMGRPRAAIASVASFVVLCLAAVVAYGIDVHAASLPILSAMGYGSSTWQEFGMQFHVDPFNQSFNSLFHHLCAENDFTRPPLMGGERGANALTWLVSLAMMGGLGACTVRYHRDGAGGEWDERATTLFLLGSLLMLLLPSLMWDHYVVQALPALFWIVSDARWRRSVGGVIAIAVIFTCLTLPIQHASSSYRTGLGILMMSFRLPGVVLLAAMLGWQMMYRPAIRRPA